MRKQKIISDQSDGRRKYHNIEAKPMGPKATVFLIGTIALASVAWMMMVLSPLAATPGTSGATEIVDPFKNYNTSLAPAGSASLAPLLGLTTNYTNNDAALDAAKSAGFTWIRKDILWQDVEISKGVYDWSAYDYLASALDSRGMKPLWLLCYGNCLYTGGRMNGPSTAAARTAFGNYAEAAARHSQLGYRIRLRCEWRFGWG